MKKKVDYITISKKIADFLIKSLNSDELKSSNLEIYRKERKVIKNGTEVPLTPKEFDILFFLASNRGEVFTKEGLNQILQIAVFDLT